MEKIQLVVCALSPTQNVQNAFSLLLHSLNSEDSERTHLSINIGIFEAQAIIAGLEKFEAERPMTHDLLKNVIDKFRGKVNEVFIYDLVGTTFYSKIIFDNCEIEARPSDAIALAIRYKAPIFIAKKIWEISAVSDDAIKTENKNKVIMKENLIAQMKIQMARAVEVEDYERAAKLRDDISLLMDQIAKDGN